MCETVWKILKMRFGYIKISIGMIACRCLLAGRGRANGRADIAWLRNLLADSIQYPVGGGKTIVHEPNLQSQTSVYGC
jgi:hypothetical protein